MIGPFSLLLGERELRTIWEVRKGGKRSYLAGTAHFFPRRFRKVLRRYVSRAETVLFEGPLDDRSMQRVADSGSTANASSALAGLLDSATVLKINAEFGAPAPAFSFHPLYDEIARPDPASLLCVEISGLKPWMAFYRIWTHYLRQYGWSYRMDRDALDAAGDLQKPVRFLETIDEQIAALEGIPVGRILTFLGEVDWSEYRRQYVRSYLAGALDALSMTTSVFPASCDSVLGRRDPVLHARMAAYFARGDAIALVGILHCPRLIELLRGEGFEVAPAGRD